MSTAIIAIIIIACTVVLYITEAFSLAVTSMLSMLAMIMTGVLTTTEAFSNFSSDTVMLVAGMMFIVEALWQCGISTKIGAFLMRYSNKGEKNFVILVTIVTAFCSMFVNNSPLLTALLPLVATVAVSSRGAITRKNTFLPMAFGALIGGVGSLAGSTLPGIASETIAGLGFKRFHFFETFPVMLVILIVIVLCYQFFLYDLLRKAFDFEETLDSSMGPVTETPSINKKNTTITLTVLALCVVCFVTTPFSWTVGQISIMGAVALIATRCIDGKESLTRINWSILIVIGATLAIAKGFIVSGAGQLVVDWLLNTFGQSMGNPLVLLTVFMVTAYLLSMFMSNGSLCAMLVSVAVPLAVQSGCDPRPVAIGLSFACQQAMATPSASVTIALAQSANYRFKDYLRIGGLVGTICLVTGWLAIVLIYGLY